MFDHAAAIGADIGRYSLRIAVVRNDGEMLALRTFPLEKSQTRENITACLFDAIREIRQVVATDGVNPICVGIAAKGFVDHGSGVILGPDQGIRNWKDVPLARMIKQETGLPAWVDNDANMMTIAEHRFGAARGFRNIVFVSLRTGIGGGIIIGGKLYRGSGNAGGEIGQMIINHDNGKSDKGIRGSWEHLASAPALVRRFLEESGSTAGTRFDNLSCKTVFELYSEGYQPAVKVVNENAGLVGIGLANLISIFAPEIIVLGGGMSEAGNDYISLIRKSAEANSLENCRKDLKIEKAQLGAAGSLIGSACWSMLRLAGQNI
jgi:glucokinase